MAPQELSSTAVTKVNSIQSAWKSLPETNIRVNVLLDDPKRNSSLPATRTGWEPQAPQVPSPVKRRSTVWVSHGGDSSTSCMWYGV